MSVRTDVIIIGAGLTGLTLGYLLGKSEIAFKIIEARDRPGGRIHTLRNPEHTEIEMGATWLGTKHSALLQLLEELDISIFKQELGKKAIYEPISTSPHQIVQLPLNDQPSYRIQGGTSRITDTLQAHIGSNRISFSESVVALELEGEFISVKTITGDYTAKKVVTTLPPYLLHKTVKITPDLPDHLVSVMQQTHTWMGESIKIALNFATPFWRKENLSGTIFSNVGPIPEMYDHSNYEDSKYALKGFLNGNYFSYSKEERLELILNQLKKYYGKEIMTFRSYEETVWRKEPFTFADYETHILPHQNNGHYSYRKPYLNDHLFIGGSETGAQHPGYMDGAVHSAQFIAEQLVKDLKKTV